MAAQMNVGRHALDEVEPVTCSARAIISVGRPAARTATAKAFTLLGKEMAPSCGDDSDQPLLF